MKDRGKVGWTRCAGFCDDCDACIEKRIECKEYMRGPGNEVLEEKPPQGAVADGTMDVIDGMKAIRAFAACERCLEEKLKCDESLPVCGGCRDKDVQCKYRLLTATLSDLSGKRFQQRGSSLSHQKNFEDTPDEVAPRQSRILVACSGCRKSMTRCSGVCPCDQCEKLGLECKITPKLRKLSPDHVASIANEDSTGTENQIEQLGGMMSDLELEGWHLVSREDFEEWVQLESKSE
ncbi:hypothetical protein N431DRAFT_427239 [Stipitochalara longipes BDJ]|nr:hypothetical protein N431DRAFT_427239 [Stipitochalara longipes BDJ]